MVHLFTKTFLLHSKQAGFAYIITRKYYPLLLIYCFNKIKEECCVRDILEFQFFSMTLYEKYFGFYNVKYLKKLFQGQDLAFTFIKR